MTDKLSVADDWIEWNGGECPVDDDAVIEPKYRGTEDPDKGVRMPLAPAWKLAWYHDGEDDDIIAYRLARERGL